MNMTPINPGRYIVAVSGGVDSMALLHTLRTTADLELIVAHYDHGIRHESASDRQFVEQVARQYKLPFVYARGELGPHASEDTARTARYAFLRNVMAEQQARAVITAHHQDDVLETIIHNVLRGTGRRGLSPMRQSSDIVRPLLDAPKADILAYAQKTGLWWHEDTTNQTDQYRRNYIRHHVVPRLTAAQRQQLLALSEQGTVLNKQIDGLLGDILGQAHQKFDRHTFIMLPHAAAKETMAAWLRAHELRRFDKKTIERLTHAAKTLHSGRSIDVFDGWVLSVSKTNLALVRQERWEK